MHLVPLELSLTVGVGSASFYLGLTAWWRNRRALGNVLYGLMAASFAVWTLADWALVALVGIIPLAAAGKLVFYLTAAFAPALVVHTAGYLSGFEHKRPIKAAYLVSLACFFSLLIGYVLLQFEIVAGAADFFLQLGAGVGLAAYFAAIMFAISLLYPPVISDTLPVLSRRRAAYGLVLLMLFAIAGSAQLFVGPVPVGFFIPLLCASFLVISLSSFVRAAFLDVELGALESFILLLAAFATVLLLRSPDRNEFWVVLIGSLAVGAFGFLAMRTLKGERHKRMYLEAANRELKLLEEAKNDFVDMVAHQLRGPLGAIRASSSMLRDGDYGAIPPKARDAATNIQDTSTRLLSLAETFLNASRLEMGKYKSQPARTDIRSEIAEIIGEMALTAAAKDLELRSVVAHDVPEEVIMDHDVLENVLFNLVDNAVKYTQHGSVVISCKLDNRHLVLSVRDTGPGFTPEECGDLFKKFHRGKAGRMHQVDGTGLGLFVVRELIEAVGGSVSATCPGLGQGSDFTARLPFQEIK
ncbi:MAG: HAMP domain-containing sensor histidine kinase [Patescibacteria group bacterium]